MKHKADSAIKLSSDDEGISITARIPKKARRQHHIANGDITNKSNKSNSNNNNNNFGRRKRINAEKIDIMQDDDDDDDIELTEQNGMNRPRRDEPARSGTTQRRRRRMEERLLSQGSPGDSVDVCCADNEEENDSKGHEDQDSKPKARPRPSYVPNGSTSRAASSAEMSSLGGVETSDHNVDARVSAEGRSATSNGKHPQQQVGKENKSNNDDEGDDSSCSDDSTFADGFYKDLIAPGEKFLRWLNVDDPKTFLTYSPAALWSDLHKFRMEYHLPAMSQPHCEAFIVKWQKEVARKLESLNGTSPNKKRSRHESSAAAAAANNPATSSDMLDVLGYGKEFLFSLGITDPMYFLNNTVSADLGRQLVPWRKSKNMAPLSDAGNMVSCWKSTLRKHLKKAGISIPSAAAANETSSQWTTSEPPAIHNNNVAISGSSNFDSLCGRGGDFLHSLGITDPSEFLKASSKDLSEHLNPWRKSQNMDRLGDPLNYVQKWKSTVRMRLREATTGISSGAELNESFTTAAEHSTIINGNMNIYSYASYSTIILQKLWAGGTDFLLSRGIKDPYQFLNTPVKDLSVHINAWRKSQNIYPLGVPASAVARWKNQVREKLEAAGLPTSGSPHTSIKQDTNADVLEHLTFQDSSNVLDNLTGYGTDFLHFCGITDPLVFLDTPTKDLSEGINEWRQSQDIEPVGDPLNLVHRWRMIVKQRIQEAEAENSAYAGDISDLASSSSDLLQGFGWMTSFVLACGITTPSQLLESDPKDLEKRMHSWRKGQNMIALADARRDINKMKAAIRERLEEAGFPLQNTLEAKVGMQQVLMVADTDDDTLSEKYMPLISLLSTRFLNEETGLPVYEFAVRAIESDGKFKWSSEHFLHPT